MKKSRILFSIVLIGIATAFAVVVRDYRILEVSSNSMSPLVHGQGAGGGSGDYVVIDKNIESDDLHVGDLVLLSYLDKDSGGAVETIRMLQNGAGTSVIVSNTSVTVPPGSYYLSATADADPSSVGLFDLTNIRGRVVKILHYSDQD